MRMMKRLKLKFTELRAGEKLHEEIISDTEILLPTENKDILLVKNENELQNKKISFKALKDITPYMKNIKIKSVLRSYV
jgi:FlaA1/EpsC-like NDP-sugar epimerase